MTGRENTKNIARMDLLNMKIFSANIDRYLNNKNSTTVRSQVSRESRLDVYKDKDKYSQF
jgi:hypothetical protein